MSSVGERGKETLVTTSLSIADRYRVILKQEYPDYINATYVNVSTGNYLRLVFTIVVSTIGIQATESLHYSTRTLEVHLQRLLEDGV